MNEDYSAIVGYSLWSTSVEVGVMSAIGKLGDIILNDWHWIVFAPRSVGVFKPRQSGSTHTTGGYHPANAPAWKGDI
jgi:hypothetical protein